MFDIVPSGPVVLNEESETSTTGIKLSWKPISKKFWNGEQVTFEVHISSMNNTWKKSYKVKKNSAIISGLRPTTTYIVNITGRTVFGPFQNVTVAVMKTKESKSRFSRSQILCSLPDTVKKYRDVKLVQNIACSVYMCYKLVVMHTADLQG